MTTPPDGGPAFPCSNEQFTFGNPQTGDAWAGLSLRDWFAGQALVGLMANNDTSANPEAYSRLAYAQAEAMLSVRSS